MTNKEIEHLLKQEHIYKWMVAKKIGIHETSLVRWFREELSEERKQQVMSAIEEIKSDRLKEDNKICLDIK